MKLILFCCCAFKVGLQAMSSQGGKLEIAGTVVGQWAGSRRGRGRASFPIQVVSVGGPTRGYAFKKDDTFQLNFFYM